MTRPADADRPTASSDGSDADDASDGTTPEPAGATPDGGEGATGRPCPVCAVPMARRHCKYVCPRHGVVYDCSDTFW